MFAQKDVVEVEAMIQELRANGDTRRVLALTALLGEVTRETDNNNVKPAAPPVDKPRLRPYLTTGEVARAIGVSPQTVKNWASAGHFPITQLGGRKVVHREHVLKYLNSLRQEPQREPPWASDDVSQEELRGRLPEELVARIDSYHERLEQGDRMSHKDIAALRALEAGTVEIIWAKGEHDGRLAASTAG